MNEKNKEKKNNKILVAKASIMRLKISAQKLNIVVALIRNMRVDEALTQLTFSSKRIAIDVKKCLQSAIANAENNLGLDIDNLIINSINVGNSCIMKRTRIRARGRSSRILKRFSNLYIVLSEENKN